MECKAIVTSELIEDALDWATAKAAGMEVVQFSGGVFYCLDGACIASVKEWHPSTDWEQGGPIIDREFIDTFHQVGAKGAIKMATDAHPHPSPSYGPTVLIAGLRCFVASKLGDVVEVPSKYIS